MNGTDATRREKRLAVGRVAAGEERTIGWRADGSLSAGVYFLRVTGERFTSTRRFTLLR